MYILIYNIILLNNYYIQSGTGPGDTVNSGRAISAGSHFDFTARALL